MYWRKISKYGPPNHITFIEYLKITITNHQCNDIVQRIVKKMSDQYTMEKKVHLQKPFNIYDKIALSLIENISTPHTDLTLLLLIKTFSEQYILNITRNILLTLAFILNFGLKKSHNFYTSYLFPVKNNCSTIWLHAY